MTDSRGQQYQGLGKREEEQPIVIGAPGTDVASHHHREGDNVQREQESPGDAAPAPYAPNKKRIDSGPGHLLAHMTRVQSRTSRLSEHENCQIQKQPGDEKPTRRYALRHSLTPEPVAALALTIPPAEGLAAPELWGLDGTRRAAQAAAYTSGWVEPCWPLPVLEPVIV
jgi:hypothetical protein